MYSFLITNDWDWVYNREWVYNGGLPDKVSVACPHWLSKRPCQLYNAVLMRKILRCHLRRRLFSKIPWPIRSSSAEVVKNNPSFQAG